MDLNLFNRQLNRVPDEAAKQKKVSTALATVEQKQIILENPIVQQRLTEIEYNVAVSGTRQPIKIIPQEELHNDIVLMVKLICHDVGIQHWNDPDKMKYCTSNFFKYILKYYSDLTKDQIKIAFEMAAAGLLDEYLPTDREGKPDKNHYQNFTMEYYTKIINAFKKKNADIWGKARKALPVATPVMSEQYKEYLKQQVVATIYDAYISYQKGANVNFTDSVYINHLIENGHLKEQPTPSAKDYMRVYRSLLMNPNLSREDKKKLRTEWEQKGMPAPVQADAQRVANNRIITLLFDDWISRGFDLITKE